MLHPSVLGWAVQERASLFGIAPRVSTLCLTSSNQACDQLSNAFPLHIYVLQAIKIWMSQRPGNKAIHVYTYGGNWNKSTFVCTFLLESPSLLFISGQLDSLNGRTKTFFTLCRKNKSEWREQQYQSLCQVRTVYSIY